MLMVGIFSSPVRLAKFMLAVSFPKVKEAVKGGRYVSVHPLESSQPERFKAASMEQVASLTFPVKITSTSVT